MFDIGWTEMLVIAVVMIVIVGPKDLPKMLRTFGKFMTKMTSMAGDFRKQFDEALKEAELDDVRNSVSDLRSLNPANEIRKAFNPMEKAAADVRAGMDTIMRPKTSVPSPPASTEASSSEPLKAGATAEPTGSGTDAASGASASATAASVEPLAPVMPLAPAVPLASANTAAAPAAIAEPVKKARAPRAPKAPTATTTAGAEAPKFKSPSAPKTASASSGVNGTAVEKPVRPRKPKETGTTT
jgi:sec-independent protein translocase protein TatB